MRKDYGQVSGRGPPIAVSPRHSGNRAQWAPPASPPYGCSVRKILKTGAHVGRRTLPYVFSESSVAVAAVPSNLNIEALAGWEHPAAQPIGYLA